MRRTAAHNHEGVHFQKTGSEEAHTIETFERKIHGTPYSEPQRRFSSQQYTERRTYGRDENGDVVMKIEKNPSDPVRPVTPVRSVTPVGGHRDSHLLKPIQPLTIPRIDINNFSPNHSPKIRYQEDVSPRSVSYQLGSPSRSANVSPRSTSSSGSIGIPLKKITKKSRWVSIHDGRPVSPYTETVTYEPAHRRRNSSVSIYSGHSAASLSPHPSPHTSASPRRISNECAYIIENPLYRD